jgi:proteasome accessory factor C
MFNQNRILRVFKLISLLKSIPAKSIKRIALSLEISERSCYRYMDLLDELGFEVTKDENNKFSLKADQIVDPFTKEESHLIQEVLTVSVKNNPLVTSIKSKLPSLEESNILAKNIVNGHLSKLVSKINEAILNKTQIVIGKYQSANTESVTDRLVEPVGFTNNYLFLCAFEIDTNQNKFFKVERMGSVEILDIKWQFEPLHKMHKPDVFGFNDSGERFKIKLKLSMRAQLWIKDDYPDTITYLKDLGDGSWLLEVEVFNMEPVNRILRSMPNDIQFY